MGFLGQKTEIGFCEPTNSYENGFLMEVWRLSIDLESIAVDHLAISANLTGLSRMPI